MALPKITLSAGISPIEGAIGTYLITLDTPAPAGGLTVYYNTTGSTATLNGDYNFTAGENLTNVTTNSFTISAGVTTATLSLSAHTDKIIDSNEKVIVNLAAGAEYNLASTTATFATPIQFESNTWNVSIISADFNNDGKGDLAIDDYYDNTILVRLGDGSGGFTGNTSVAVGNYPESVTTADFNGDGNADLATANEYGTVSVRLGDGSGGFTRTTEVAVSKFPKSIISADFNNDGKADLATANSFNNTISVRLGNGSGGFTGTTEVEVGLGRYSDTTPVSIISADFNGDGKADLATANRDSDTISVRLGDGSGGFYGTTEVAAGLSPESIIGADFNGDGKADLATANGSGLSVSVRLGDGSGGFYGTTEVEVDSNPSSIISADFNGDGKADLATANNLSVSVRLGDGSGGFYGATKVAAGLSSDSIISADFNNDGKADLATANFYDNTVLLLNTSSSSVALTIADVAPPVNHSPALIGTYAILTNGIEDTTYTINASNLLQGFSDIDGDTLSIANLVVNNGVLIDNTNATWTFTPNVNYNGAIALTYNVIDGNGGSIAATQNFALTAMDDVPTGTVTINDTTPEQNQTLIASNTLVDADGLGIINYLWQANGVDLVTANSYTLTSNEVGKTIQVIASYADNFGHVESVSSASTSVVVAANHLPTGTVTISDTSPEQSQALTVSNTLTDADGLGVISYTWLANGVNVGIGNNHTVTSNEFGKTLVVTASYTDGLGNVESVSSASTSAVTKPKITLSPGTSPTEGAIGTYIITLDTPAPASGLMVFYNTTGSTATFNGDYNFTAGENLTNVTDNSFFIAAGVTTAILNLVAIVDAVIDPNEIVMVNVTSGMDYHLLVNNIQFTLPPAVAVGINPASVISADFNGDENIDLATANWTDNTVSVRLGNGKGGFTGNTTVAVDYHPYSVISADFNGDGNLDLATANWTGNTVSVRLGNGKGGFTGNTTVAVGINPASVITADFNGDGNIDLATANAGDNTVSVRLGNGKGGFTGNTTVAVDYHPYSVISADFNGDGNLDLATANWTGNTVSVRLGNGKGGFTGNTTLAVGINPISVISADFNGDGNADLATANAGDNTVSVRLGNGSGGFTGNTSIAVGDYPESVISADFNGDGNADLATANGNNNTVSVRLGDGSGGFTGNISVAVGDEPWLVISADFNNDGNADLATANYSSDTVSVLLNTTNTTAKLTITDIAPPLNQPPLGSVTISDNTPEQNQVLTAANTLTDADGLGTVTYSWFADDLNIGTGSTYTVTADEIGKTLAVTASYTDGLGKVESISSASTSAVTVPIAAGFTISPLTPQTTDENGATASYSVHLNTAPLLNQDVVITFASSDASEGLINNPTLTFTSSNYATPQTLTVQGVDDYLGDGDIPYQVTAKISTTDVFYKSLAINSFSLTNTDDGLDKALDLYGDKGGSKIDVLIGGNGADKLHGLNMADDLSGGLGHDSLWGGYGDDNLHGNAGDDKLNGEQENDLMEGGTGNDTLDGGDGVDTMIGGAGNDTYYLGYDAVDVIDDQGLASDVDVVIMPYQLSKYTLPKGIEQGTIAPGTGSSNLTGNIGDNTLTGNDGKNILNGAVGRDSLFGGLGDDVLIGGTGNDVLKGGTGKDNLIGGSGKDSFMFDTAIKANIDKITDFKPIDDTITLENQIFTKLTTTGVLNSANFVTATAAHDSNDYLVYNKATGALFYDADGSGAGAGIQIATVGVNLALTAVDFVIV